MPIYDDNIGDRHSLMASSAALTEIVIDGDDKKSKFLSPLKFKNKRRSFDKIQSYDKMHQSPFGKILNKL